MENKTRCWFFINPNIKERDFAKTEETSGILFTNFLSDKNYNFKSICFQIFVSKIVNYGQQLDLMHKGYLQIAANIDYEKFNAANNEEKEVYTLNAALVMLRYFQQRMPVPAEVEIDELIIDYEHFLSEKGILLSEYESSIAIVKPFDAFRFRFIVSTPWEVKSGEIHYDLNHLQDFLNNNLVGKGFGGLVRQFDFGYEIYDYEGEIRPSAQTANLRRYSPKNKSLLIVKQFDYRQLKGKNFAEQFGILRQKINEAIADISELKKKPLSFDANLFSNKIDELLARYEEERFNEA